MSYPNIHFAKVAILSTILLSAPISANDGLLAPENPFQMNAETIAARCDEYIGKLRSDLNAITSRKDVATFDSVMRPFDVMASSFYDAYFIDNLMKNAHKDENVRKASEGCTQAGDEAMAKVSLDTALYARMSKIKTKDLPSEETYMVNYWITQFKIGGIDKDKATRDKLESINNEISKISDAFGKNILEDVRSLSVSADRLKGLPEDYISSHKADASGMVRITTSYSDIGPVFKYAEDDKIRHDLLLKFDNRAYPVNEPILKELLVKRHELATLLGHNNFAELAMLDRMMKTPERAREFTASLNEAIKNPVEIEKARLLDRLQKIDPSAKTVNTWQRSYIANLIRQEEYALDAKEVRQYFRYDKVRDGILKLSEDMFDIEIRKWDTPVWDSDVEAYQVYENDQLIGQFYFDSHPRDGKYTHAAQFPVQFGIKGKQVPIGTLLMNFPNGLMEHGQVETFLHEYGHLLHYIFAGQSDIGFRRFMSESDFGEAPSGMLEEWVWDYDTLAQFATNEAGEVIPKELVKKMNAARYFGQALGTSRQLQYTALSLILYDHDPAKINIAELDEKIANQYSAFGYTDGTHSFASFGHLAGYSSNYYTYQWSNAIAEELMSRFKAEGLRNKQTAKDYREKVLGATGTRSANQLVTDFLGRQFTIDAYVRRLSGEE